MNETERPDPIPGRSANDTIRLLMSPALERVTGPATPIGLAQGDGLGHLPFLAWLVAAVRPTLAVGITRRRAAAQDAIAEAMAREQIAGTVLDLSLADPAAGLPVSDASVGILHADAELWRSASRLWRRALAPDGVLVLHGPFGETADLLDGHTLSFAHDGGLLVSASRAAGSDALASLWAIATEGGERLATLRTRFAWLGEASRRQAAAREREGSDRDETMRTALRDRIGLQQETARTRLLETELRASRYRADRFEERWQEAERGRLAALEQARSLPWRRAKATPPGPPARPRDERGGSVLFVSGEPDTAGTEFRARRASRICAAAGRPTRWIRIEAVGPEALEGVALLVLWRAPWTTHVQTMVGIARGNGTVIAYDVDDLVVEPSLADPAVIDAMRTTGIDVNHLAYFFSQQRTTLEQSDLAIATTEELATRLRLIHPAVHVIPNGVDDEAYEKARLERRMHLAKGGDGLIRIGYASGTQSHQRDFRVAAGAIVALLTTRVDLRLVLFRDDEGEEMLIAGEFPALAAVADRIEWRAKVPVAELAAEIARFDIAICPLEVGNEFCECKSEVKFIEAALAGIPCVASPTGPLSRAIIDGRTGLIAKDEAAWCNALTTLVEEPETRARIGRDAMLSVLWRFGQMRLAGLWDDLLAGLGDARQAAMRHELHLRRGPDRESEIPVVATTTTLFAYDSLRPIEVAVAVTSFNYAHYVLEALDSVASQSLQALELVVVDNGSTDGSTEMVVAWARRHCRRFARVRIERSVRNFGLGPARNAAFALAEARYVMSLDADNRLLPACCELLLARLLETGAAFAYPRLRVFGEDGPSLGGVPYDPARFVAGNYIDAMAMVARSAWACAGGYYDQADARGWEDFGLWCRMAERGLFGVWHEDELAEYRMHSNSMTNQVIETPVNKERLVSFIEARHPWVRLRSRFANPR